MKKVLLLVLLFLSFFFLPQQAFATENFNTAYTVTYTIDEAGITHTLMKVGLTNTSSQYYASSYKIHVGFDDITNLKASDPDGPMKPTVAKSDDGHIITVVFNKKVVGKGNTLNFTLTFDTMDIAKKRGSVWGVTIPGIADQNDFTTFTVSVKVPKSFGSAAYIKPSVSGNGLIFTKEQLGNAGISMAFGEQQGYKFYLTYHLSNNNVFPIQTQIALPPSTNYQDVSITSIDPKPVNVTEDRDGNWLAEYKLDPSEKVDVIVQGTSTLSLTPKRWPESEADLALYTKEQQYWQVSNSQIQKLAKQLKTPEAIYVYVVKTLHYDFNRVSTNEPRLGAAGVLKNPNSAVCLEFTDLFIALARAAGIPAREVNGYAYTENDRQRPLSLVKDILHAWPEYYDRQQQTWIMVDPTWGNTTGGMDYFHVLDFDHFTFVQKGVSSTYPIPAGGYKNSNADEGKDVHVDFGQIEPASPSKVAVLPVFSEKNIALLPIHGAVQVTNAGQGMTAKQIVTIASNTLQPNIQQLTVPEIPPYGHVLVPVTFQALPFLTNGTRTFTIQLADTTLDHTLVIVPFSVPSLWIFGGIILGILCCIIFIIALKSGRLPFFRRK